MIILCFLSIYVKTKLWFKLQAIGVKSSSLEVVQKQQLQNPVRHG